MGNKAELIPCKACGFKPQAEAGVGYFAVACGNCWDLTVGRGRTLQRAINQWNDKSTKTNPENGTKTIRQWEQKYMLRCFKDVLTYQSTDKQRVIDETKGHTLIGDIYEAEYEVPND